MGNMKQVFVRPLDHGRKVMPCSEVCLSMRVADTVMYFQLLESGMVQLYSRDKQTEKFSFPITAAEAGLHWSDTQNCYYYLEE